MTKARCVECGRRFDLMDEDDASEWYYGHDCEEPEADEIDNAEDFLAMATRVDGRTTHICRDSDGAPMDRGDGMGTPLPPVVVTCGGCGRSWCDFCDGAHGPLCHWCHGRGYSTAPIGKRQFRSLTYGGGAP